MPKRPSRYIREGLSTYWLLVRVAENIRRLSYPGSYELYHSIRTALGVIRKTSKDVPAGMERAGDKWLNRAVKLFSSYITYHLKELNKTPYQPYIDQGSVHQREAKACWDKGQRTEAFIRLMKTTRRVRDLLAFEKLLQEYIAFGFESSLPEIYRLMNNRDFYAAKVELRTRVRRLEVGESEPGRISSPGVSLLGKDDARTVVYAADPVDRDRFNQLRKELIGLGFGPEMGRYYTILSADRNIKRALEMLEQRIGELKKQQHPQSQRQPQIILMKRDPEPLQVVVEPSSLDVPTIQTTVVQVVAPEPPNPLEVAFNETAAEPLRFMEEIRLLCPGVYAEQSDLLKKARRQYLDSKGKSGPINDAKAKLDAIVRRCREYLQRQAVLAQDQSVPVALPTPALHSNDQKSQTNTAGPVKHRKQSRGQIRRAAHEAVWGKK